MKIKEMIASIQPNRIWDKDKAKPNRLMTKWGEALLNSENPQPLTEYPRPQLVRDNYAILNGYWRYAFTKCQEAPSQWDGEILVPFSPETVLSGVERQLMPNEYLWYERDLELADMKGRLILHFGACDERCKVYVNHRQVGRHFGGYQSFSMDITDYVEPGKNTVMVCVQDMSDTSYHGKGKQCLKNGGMFYTAQSGLWQTVWYEWVPKYYIKDVRITPVYDEDRVVIAVKADTNMTRVSYCAEVLDKDESVGEMCCTSSGALWEELSVRIPDKKSWSPVSPFLYRVKISLHYEDSEDNADNTDEVESYFGMRCFSVEKDRDGVPRLCLNHVPYFQNGVLDQGYYPESLLTPPSDEAMIHDIQFIKSKGFNMIRKHCKIEPMRWYYHCDRLGVLVWQDMINGGGTYNLLKTCYIPNAIPPLQKLKDNHYSYTARQSLRGRREWKKECAETVTQLYNCTSICMWVLFNEGWGQFDALKNTAFVRRMDSTRLIDAHSGWFDQEAGDVKSEHTYFFELSVKRGEKPYVLSEYGGISLIIEGHTYSQMYFGYGVHDSREQFFAEYKRLFKRIEKLKREGLCAAVYTQLSDIEEEVNGLMTYDRRVEKI